MLQAAIQEAGHACTGQLVNVPLTTVDCSEEDELNYKVIDRLDEIDDVSSVEHNMAVATPTPLSEQQRTEWVVRNVVTLKQTYEKLISSSRGSSPIASPRDGATAFMDVVRLGFDNQSASAALVRRALKLLGATEEEVRVERAVFMSTVPMDVPASRRVLIEVEREETEDSTPTSKPSKVLGLPTEPPLEWLQRRASLGDSQAFKRPGCEQGAGKWRTIDDVRIEKALLVLGEAPGREVPAGSFHAPNPPLMRRYRRSGPRHRRSPLAIRSFYAPSFHGVSSRRSMCSSCSSTR